jgi:hypothetical protein
VGMGRLGVRGWRRWCEGSRIETVAKGGVWVARIERGGWRHGAGRREDGRGRWATGGWATQSRYNFAFDTQLERVLVEPITARVGIYSRSLFPHFLPTLPHKTPKANVRLGLCFFLFFPVDPS